jgi:hypothetical protein
MVRESGNEIRIWSILSGLSLALGIAGFVAPLVWPALETSSLKAALVSASFVAISFGIFMIDNANRVSNSSREMRELHKELAIKLNDKSFFFLEGDVVDVIGKMESRFKRAKYIRNVYVPFSSRRDPPYSLLDTERNANLERFANNPKSRKYTEIVGRDSHLSYGKQYREFILGLGEQESKKFEIRVLNRIFPLINFIILSYGEGDSEVLFGWGGYVSSTPEVVFSSREKSAIAMFDQMFSSLLAMSGSSLDVESVIHRLERYKGYWVDIAMASKLGSDVELVNAAILEFYFEGFSSASHREPRLAVRGKAFRVENGEVTSEVVRTFESRSCEMRGDFIYVAHYATSPSDIVGADASHGHSVYDFSSYQLTKTMRAEIMSPLGITGHGGKVIHTHGKKITSAESADISKIWHDHPALAKLCDRELKSGGLLRG